MIKKIITVIVVVAILVGLYKITSQNPNPSEENNIDSESADLIVFWGEGCPHCENVKEYVTENDVDSKIKISWKEVYENKQNQIEMTNIVKQCPEIDTTKDMGVPLAFSTKEKKCFMGDVPIIDWMEAQSSSQ